MTKGFLIPRVQPASSWPGCYMHAHPTPTTPGALSPPLSNPPAQTLGVEEVGGTVVMEGKVGMEGEATAEKEETVEEGETV